MNAFSCPPREHHVTTLRPSSLFVAAFPHLTGSCMFAVGAGITYHLTSDATCHATQGQPQNEPPLSQPQACL